MEREMDRNTRSRAERPTHPVRGSVMPECVISRCRRKSRLFATRRTLVCAAMLRPFLPLLFASAALSAASLFAQPAPAADTVVNPFAGRATAAQAGSELFGAICQICHGTAGEGNRDRGGSALNTTGLKHGDGDGDLFRVIKNGVTGTQMPSFAVLSDQQVWQVVSFIRTLQPTAPDVGANAAPITGDVAAGEALFFGQTASCSSCHEINGRGGVTGPDLSGAARLGAAALRQKIVAPNEPARAGRGGRGNGGGRGGFPPSTAVARTRDGREIRGVRRNEDAFSVQLVDAKGQLHLLDKLQLASFTVEDRSLMPDDFAQRLSATDITNLVAFLASQQERNLTKTGAPLPAGGVTYDRLRRAAAEPQNWLTYWGDYQGTHFSALKQITADNVKQLKTAWTFPIPGGSVLECTPLVVDGVMYVTGGGNPATVVALDARTGRQIWRWTRPQKVVNPYQINPFNRGVAILGHRLFVGTLDAALIALDARTGQQLWEVQVADTMDGHNLTSAPLVLKDMVITGVAGGEYATRGFLEAYDVATGQRRWRFNTIPGPGEPGHETWLGDSWKVGGAPAWLTGSYDPELNLLYWTIGNPSAQYERLTRGALDNLYTNSVVALDPDTGTRKWHFQFTPNDTHDWDSNQDVVLVDRPWHGQNRKLLIKADRNGHFYVLDRVTGAFLAGTPYIYQNWNAGFDARGKPQQIPESISRPEGTYLVYPTAGGGTNWQSPSYSSLTGWLYFEYSEGGQLYIAEPEEVKRGQMYLGKGPARPTPARRADQPAPNSGIKAIDPENGKTMWDFKIFQGSLANGVLATGGNVLFASTRDGNLTALDAKTGVHLWHFQTGGSHAASPMSYALDGKQYITLCAGNVVYSFALPE